MNAKIKEIATRMKELREITEVSVEEMAKAAELTPEEYLACESGERDFNFTFLFACAQKFGVDITEIITGETPRLNFYNITRAGEGLPIQRRMGFSYQHLAPLFKKRGADPFIVTAPYSEEEQNKPIKTRAHEGQEFNYILSGQLKYNLNGQEEVLRTGDSIFFDGVAQHGMIATGGEPCVFMSIVFK